MADKKDDYSRIYLTRSYSYVLGEAQAFFLNDLYPGWQTAVLIEDETLSVRQRINPAILIMDNIACHISTSIK